MGDLCPPAFPHHPLPITHYPYYKFDHLVGTHTW
jgi:hypothetical protein